MADPIAQPNLDSPARRTRGRGRRGDDDRSEQEKLYFASQWQLMGRKFARHRLAIVGLVVLVLFYLAAMLCEFVAPYDPYKRYADNAYQQPQRIRFIHQGRLHLPFVYAMSSEFDRRRFINVYTPDTAKPLRFQLFVPGDPYKLLGFIPATIHLFGSRDGPVFLFGTDELGRDLFSQTIIGARISLSIGLVGVLLSFVLGCILGGISGYFGGGIDTVIQRVIEFLISLPTIPLWMALAAALPRHWGSVQTYFGITIILSIVGWCGIARVVRGKLLELRGEDFVLAAQLSGLRQGQIIARHLLPAFLSYLIVNLTLSIPSMILAETALSFLGLGIRPPAMSWGVLLQQAQSVRSVLLHPWFLIPGLFVITTVLAFNFLGDGLRDAADPYK